MQTLPAHSALGMIGTWVGWGYPDMPASMQGENINSLLAEVRSRVPNYAQTTEIVNKTREVRNLLMQHTLLGQEQIRFLLDFMGTAKEFAPYIEQATLPLHYAIRAKVSDELEILRSLKVRRSFDLLNQGALGFTGQQDWHQHNKITDLLTTSFSKLLRGTGGVNDTLEVQSVVVGAGYSAPASTQTALDHQLGSAKAPDDSTYTGYQTTFLTSFITTDNNGAYTTVATAASATSFTLTSATGFQTGDRIEIEGQKRTISNLSGVTVTLDKALTGAPTVGATVQQIWGETGLLINGNSVLGTRSRIADGGYNKGNATTNPKAIFIESAITVRIVGV